MRAPRQTSVLISPSAGEALAEVTRRWGLSRDAAVRRLLAKFIERQRDSIEERRLTHISTALMYPLCLQPTGEKVPRHRLTFRTHPLVVEEAVSLAYRLPGHARRQAHRDYASRPLTDALVTALALEQPLIELGLEGLPDTLQWREADGLWRLTVAATLTRTERLTHNQGPPDLIAMLEDAEVVWHSPWRAQMALHLGRGLFTGPRAEENRSWVGEQRDHFHTELENLSDPRVVMGGHEYTDGAPSEGASAEGRAATAIWRCQRRIALEGLARWFTTASPNGSAATVIDPPEWNLQQPRGWRSRRMPTTQRLDPRFQALVDQGAVLRIAAGNTSALWPLAEGGGPVPGLGQVVAGARQLRLSAIEIAEAVLVTHHAPDEDKEDRDEIADHLGLYPVMGIEMAFAAGLVDADERDRAVRDSQNVTLSRIRAALESARQQKYAADELRRLHQAKEDPLTFARVADDLALAFRIAEPMWTWKARSVPDILAQAASPQQLEIRGREWCRHVRLALERDMHRAWTEAMWEVSASRGRDDDVEVWYSPWG